MDDFIRKDYFSFVTMSDEAFVWVVMDGYYTKWEENNRERAGAKVGFTNTACKKKKEFEAYCNFAGDSRERPNSLLWSERLKEIARTEMMAERENDDEPEPVAPNDNESDVEGQANDDYNRRLRNSLGGTAASSDEEDYDDHADDETNNGGDNTTAV
jgi:hypothetical protein